MRIMSIMVRPVRKQISSKKKSRIEIHDFVDAICHYECWISQSVCLQATQVELPRGLSQIAHSLGKDEQNLKLDLLPFRDMING